MECIHCGGQMERSTARFTAERRGYHVSWDAVPAWVCTQCGEAYFEADEVEAIQRALSAVDHETDRLSAAG
jgi:YgiT-type zinc finger domain-containing protein